MEPMGDFEVRRRLHWYTYVGDFLNTLKAFCGTNYQALPFAFANSGLAVGFAGVFLVAFLTDHCCQILVRCKIYIIEKVCKDKLRKGMMNEEEVTSLMERLQVTVGYGDIGKLVFGDCCYRVIQAAVCITQFLTCLAYFVFIANTISAIFPLQKTQVCNVTDNMTVLALSIRPSVSRPGIPMLSIPQIALDASSQHKRSASPCNCSSDAFGNLQQHAAFDQRAVSMPRQFNEGNVPEMSLNEEMTALPGNSTSPCSYVDVPTALDLRLLVLFPLPFFLLTSLIRNVRYLGPFSSIATVALAAGASSVLGFLIHDFKVMPFEWYKIFTLPLFFCQLISAYEGIGCILPIQSSMVGCRHLFPRYLHANIGLIFFILCTFGALGYVSFGDGVKQIIVLEIAQHSILAIVVDVTLIISVLFTYPLQCFPVIEIIEAALLGEKPPPRRISIQEIVQEPSASYPSSEVQPLIRSTSLEMSVSQVANAVISPKIPSWKRNIIRIILTLVIAGLAVLLRDYFAYLSAFSGAVGCSLLAFILPCLFDIRLRHREMSRLILIKNIVIVAFACVISVLGIIVIIMTMAKGNAVV